MVRSTQRIAAKFDGVLQKTPRIADNVSNGLHYGAPSWFLNK